MENVAVIGARYKTTKINLFSKETSSCEPRQEYSLYLFTDGAWWGYDRKIESLSHADDIIKSYGIHAVFTNARDAETYINRDRT